MTIRQHRLQTVCYKCRTHRDATRIWNWIDHQEDCDQLWALMANAIPWAFNDTTNPNTIIWSY